MKRIISTFVVLMLTASFALVGTSAAQDSAMRTFAPLDRGLAFDPNIEMVIDPVYESILASWRWTE